MTWLIFGTNGRTAAQILSALKAGYRSFDCAESYANDDEVIEALSQFKQANGLSRNDVEIIYKFFDPSSAAKLLEFLKYIDVAIIHNVDDYTDADLQQLWQRLVRDKQEGKVLKIGIGNLTYKNYDIISQLESIDVVEDSVFGALDPQSAVRQLKDRFHTILYYHIRQFCANIFSQEDADVFKTAMECVIEFVDNAFPSRSRPILSARNAEQQAENLLYFNEVSGEAFLHPQVAEQISAWLKKESVCTIDGGEVPLSEAATTLLKDIVDLKIVSSDFTGGNVLAWLMADKNLVAADLDAKVPQRRGLKMEYVDQSLLSILTRFFGDKSCDQKVAIALLQVLLIPVNDWGVFRDHLPEITARLPD